MAEIARPEDQEDQFDEQETAERETAARAYADENERHYVSFLEDCVKTSVEAMRDIRQNQKECWAVFNEDEPANYAKKEPWQSRVMVPKPHATVFSAQALVRKAFDAEFLSIENALNDEDAKFIKDLMSLMLSRTYANFPIQITDATGMGFAIGQSLEMIPQWENGGLTYALAEPWKIHRDPDSVSRKPWSGMYWIHQEDIDYWVLKEGEEDGSYQNIPFMGPGSKWGERGSNPDLTEFEIARRKGMWTPRSKFRSMVRVSEFWGTILAPNGEKLLSNATFTVAGDKVIREPKASQYPSIRWPGVSFAPIPHLLRYDGRSLLQGIKSLWGFMNNLFCLHADDLNWVVNPPWEMDISALVDPMDVDMYPGKGTLTKGTVQGQQAFRFNERGGRTGDILANLNFADQRYQEGVLFTAKAQGLPGYRAEVTKGEAAQDLEQSMNVVGLMGKNLEDGALYAINAGYETVAINITSMELARIMGPEVAARYADPTSPTGLRLPSLGGGSFRVSGVAALMKDMEIIRSVREVIVKEMASNPLFQPYLKPYQICLAVEKRLYLRDEGLFVDSDTAKRVDDLQQTQQEAAVQAQQALTAAEAAMTQAKTLSEQAKALMNEAKAFEHEGKGTLARAKAETEGMEVEAASTPPAPPQPSETDIAKAEQIRALIPYETDLAAQKVESERATTELTMAKARAAEVHPGLAAQKVDSEKAVGELTRAKAKTAAKTKTEEKE